MNLSTPIEPIAPRAAAASPLALRDAREATHALLFGRIACAVASSCGSVHAANEDAHSVLDQEPLFVVADGVGGGAMAGLASRQLVAHLHAELAGRRLDAPMVSAAMLEADRVIAERIAESTQRPGAATVALCAPLNAFASRWLVAWVGDCRVYQSSAADGHAVRLLTRDDTFSNLGETPAPGGSPGDPARMVGNGAVSCANVVVTELAPADALLVCSDGVHKFVAPERWQALMQQGLPLLRQCDELVAQARAQGSTDDATALLVRRTVRAGARAQWLRALVKPSRTSR
jgi:protein phosphatase